MQPIAILPAGRNTTRVVLRTPAGTLDLLVHPYGYQGRTLAVWAKGDRPLWDALAGQA